MPNERDRVFRILAVRAEMVSSKVLAEAERELSENETVGLAEVLQRRGALTAEARQTLENLVDKHLERHGVEPDAYLPPPLPLSGEPPTTVEKQVNALDETLDLRRENASTEEELATTPPEQQTLDWNKTQVASPPKPKEVDSRYSILRSHARGGMGTVSLAKDTELDREVAFKELQDYCADDSNSRARFVREAVITGRLEHPGVVPIYGLGAYPDGRPYYAMRFVQGDSLAKQIARFHRGEKISRNFSRHSLEFRALLSRFVDVCNAIAYAHSRGVVHRDIKPDNIMLGKFGETLVVDWGLAKALDRTEELPGNDGLIRLSAGEESTATRMGSATGTPAYMSPEQAAGQLDRIGPVSDVYSLGATLYCILTGQAPFSGIKVTEVLRKARNGEYLPPKQINPSLPATMNSICCKAMSIVPAERYQTPLALAGDIENWLSDQAVSSHREGALERGARWIRRHRTWALAGAAALALVATISVIAAIQIDRQRQIALDLSVENEQLANQEREAKQTAVERLRDSRETVDAWLTGFSEALGYYPGVQEFRERMLLRAAEDYERFVATEETEQEMEIERGRALMRLGDVRRTLLQLDLADQAFDNARKVFERLSSEELESSVSLVELPQTMLRQAILAGDRGEADQAAALFQETIDKGLAIVESNAGNVPAQLVVADARARLGFVWASEGKLDEAEALLKRSVTQVQTQVEQAPHRLELIEALANARIALGQLLLQRGDVASAQREFEESSGNFQVLIAIAEDNPKYLESGARALINLATTHRLQGKWDLEAEAYQQAIADYQLLIRAMPDVPTHRENVALTQTDLGQLYRESFQPTESLDQLNLARSTLEELVAEYPGVVRFHEERATCLDNLGQVLFDLGSYSESLEIHRQANDLFTQLAANVPDVVQYRERLGISHSHLGVVYGGLQLFEKSEAEFRTALETLEGYLKQFPESDSCLKSLAITNKCLGDTLLAAKSPDSGRAAYVAAKDYWTKLIERSPEADYLNRAALFHVTCKEESVRDGELGLDYARRAVESAPTNALYCGTLAAANYRSAQFSQAALLAAEAIRKEGGNKGQDYLILAMAQLQLGQVALAQQSLSAATTWRISHLPGKLELVDLEHEATLLKAEIGASPKSP